VEGTLPKGLMNSGIAGKKQRELPGGNDREEVGEEKKLRKEKSPKKGCKVKIRTQCVE